MITPPQGTVEYQESGDGQTIVFVPGSFSAGSSWRNISTPLSERYRTITTSLSGYGKTQERRKPGGTHMEDEMDVLEAVLYRADAPVHLVAHSFGAWVALSMAIRRSPKLMSMTLLEPTAFNLLGLGGESALNREVHAMTDRYMTDWESGNQQAVRHVIDFYGETGTFDAYPPAVQEKLIGQTPTNILDWKTGYADPMKLADLAAVKVPTLVVCGGSSHRAMQRCNQLLVDRLPRAQIMTLEGANHFMIGSHASALAHAIEQHTRAVTSG
ncbi:alpha/beta fold hydrolase [Polaromonas sp.]|uniref:alpha/beta fold hydrolase n=1 Tax=Polaromonas sp. TaxID=1869339 RepID=UPI00272FC386|nr:alpha/beta hydrolase [Polaromonas sp.]MDP1740181.1 alpha/beta hydrolase [Polaromonas sp.]